MRTPWEQARDRKSQKQERRLGKLPNSRQQPNSGRGRLKRDARVFGHYLVEARTTDADSYTIKRKEFQDITKQAHRQPPGCNPAMAVEIQGLRLWVMLEDDFTDMQQRLEVAGA